MISFLKVQNQYQIIHKIDSRKFLDTYIARCIPTNNAVTIKIYNLDDPNFGNSKCNLKILNDSTSFWFNEQHQNLIHYYGSFISGYKLWCISEFMDCGSCTDALRQIYTNGIDNEILISTILKSVISLIAYLHKDNKVYRRICPSNILFSALGDVKMDLIFTPKKELPNNPFTPPEFNEKENSSLAQKIDIYDIGITAITLAIGKNPDNDVIDLFRSKSVLPNHFNFSSSFFDFVNSCIKLNPTKRPTAEQLLQHKFIKNAQGQNYLKVMFTSLLLPLNQQYERFETDESNADIFNLHARPSKLQFEFTTATQENTSNIQNNEENDQSKEADIKIRYKKKTIGRITLAGPEETLNVYQ